MFRRGRKPAEPPGIGDAMRGLARAFAEGAAADGFPMAVDVGAEDVVEAYLGAIAYAPPPEEVLHSIIVSGGAFLGELIRTRTSGSEWIDQEGSPVLRVGGLTVFPLDKVAKRIHVGSEHDVARFVRAASDRRVFDEERRAGNIHALGDD